MVVWLTIDQIVINCVLLCSSLLCSAFLRFTGGICKEDLKRMMAWAASTYELPVLLEIARAHPTVSHGIVLRMT